MRLYIRERKGAFAFPASDGTVLVAANLMHDEFVRARHDREAAFHARVADVAPDLHAMLPEAARTEEFHAGCTRAFVREAAGPGWALVGDAGMKKDPVTAQGISTAFRCAEMAACAADEGFGGVRPLDEALAAYAEARDEWLLPYYRFTAQLARFARPTERLAAYYRAIRDDPAETARLFGAVALTHSPEGRAACGLVTRSGSFYSCAPPPTRHGRACPGHPRVFMQKTQGTWMPGTSPGMTMCKKTALGGIAHEPDCVGVNFRNRTLEHFSFRHDRSELLRVPNLRAVLPEASPTSPRPSSPPGAERERRRRRRVPPPPLGEGDRGRLGSQAVVTSYGRIML